MQRTKILIFVASFLVLFLVTSVAFAKPVAPPTTPSSAEEAFAVADGAPATAPGMEIVVQTPGAPYVP